MDILKSFTFGLTLAISIGPIAILIMNYGVNWGKQTAMLSGLGAALADLTYSLIGFSFNYSLVSILNRNREAINTTSTIVLVGFGIYMLLTALKKKDEGTQP